MFVSKPKDGQAEYINLSYMMPYDFLLTPARAAMEAYTQNGAVDANQATKIKDMAKASLGKFLEPFASEALAAERIADVTYRGGQTQTGSIVYRDAEDDGDKVKKSVIHVMGGFLPGIVEQFGTVSGGEFVRGRTARALTGLPGKQGQEYTPAEEAATMMTGFRRMNLDLKNNFQYKGFEYSSARRQADGILNNAISANDTSAGDVLNAYNESLRLRRRFQQQLYQDIQAAKSLGLSDRAIVTQLSEDANLGKDEIALIMRGRFSPRKPTRSMAATVLREARVQNQARALQRLPIREMAEIYRREVNSPLIPVREETPAPEAQGAPARAAAPAQTAPQRQQQQAAPAPSPAPEERQAPPAELLGGNLFDRMRNAELLRQRGEE